MIVDVEVYDDVIVKILLNIDNYKILNKPEWVGKKMYSKFANDLYDAFAEQYPELEYELRKNQRGEPG